MSRFEVRKANFYLDGEPFKIISGTIHYFRVVPEYWEDRLHKLRSMGCNTVETYIPWNLHEPHPGSYNFTGICDVARFLKIAQEIGLYAIVRPSPYICAEWEFGGQPAWLLADGGIPVRTKEGSFLKLMDRYYEVLFSVIRPLQIDCGGPIILMQTENEYGAYGCDTEYLEMMDAIMRKHGATVPFITSDNFEQDFNRGIYDGALPTANFGSGAKENFEKLSAYNRGGPLMCTEFWAGWFDAWGNSAHHVTSAQKNAAELDTLLSLGNVNIYMFHGGTNFGFMNGSNYYDRLTPDVTSYDYDAPLAEDGEITPKYHLFREVIAKYVPVPPLYDPPVHRREYDTLIPAGCAPLFKNLDALSEPIYKDEPCAMEELGQNYGYILYSHTVKKNTKTLRFISAQDRVQVFADGKSILTLFDKEIPGTHKSALWAGQSLHILVENLGRVNFGPKLADQRKGIIGSVEADGEQLKAWVCRPLPLRDLSRLCFDQTETQEPAFYRYFFTVDEPEDTYLSLAGWGKGCAFINGFNLGRYWNIGPQRRLYVPAPLLYAGKNELVVFETEGIVSKTVCFKNTPLLG